MPSLQRRTNAVRSFPAPGEALMHEALSASVTARCSCNPYQFKDASMNTPTRTLLLALLLLPLIACGDSGSSTAGTEGSPAERIIARETAQAPSAVGDQGIIEIDVDGSRHFFSLERTTGFRNSGMGEISISLKAGRMRGEGTAFAEATLANLRPVEGTQTVGDGEPRPVHILLSGVPGHDGALRSLQGEVQVESLVMDEDQRFESINARFTGRFSAYAEDRKVFVDPTHADAIEITGRLSIAR
jgi:hypothetical protein